MIHTDWDVHDMDQDIELRHLRYFLAVAEELHFGQAAKRLHIAQPPLSQQIRRLEELLGYALFVRSSRSVRLTLAGEALRDRARRTLGKVSEDLEAVRSIARGEVGSLTIGFVGSAMLTRLPSILNRYRSLYAGVQLRLRELHTSALLEQIRQGSIDVGLVRDGGVVDDMHVEAVYTEPFVAVMPRRHKLAAQTRVPVARLRDEPFVFFPRAAGNFAWENTIALCERQGFRPHIVQEAPQWLTILRLVGAGLGVSIAPESVRRIRDAAVACRNLSPSGGKTTIDLAYRADQTSPLVKSFCELAREVLRA